MFLLYLTYWLSVVLRLKSRLFHLAYQAICDTIPAYFPASSHPLAPYRSAMWTFLQDHKHTIFQPSSPFSLCPLNLEHNFLLSPYLLLCQGNYHGAFRSFSAYLLKGEAFWTIPHPFLLCIFYFSLRSSMQDWKSGTAGLGEGRRYWHKP